MCQTTGPSKSVLSMLSGNREKSFPTQASEILQLEISGNKPRTCMHAKHGLYHHAKLTCAGNSWLKCMVDLDGGHGAQGKGLKSSPHAIFLT